MAVSFDVTVLLAAVEGLQAKGLLGSWREVAPALFMMVRHMPSEDAAAAAADMIVGRVGESNMDLALWRTLSSSVMNRRVRRKRL